MIDNKIVAQTHQKMEKMPYFLKKSTFFLENAFFVPLKNRYLRNLLYDNFHTNGVMLLYMSIQYKLSMTSL